LTSASRKRPGKKRTISTPTVGPNRATEIATTAKWYHIVTLTMRVGAISSTSVDFVTRNSCVGPEAGSWFL
jgi:hypothetical protein